MKARLLYEERGLSAYALVFAERDEVLTELESFAGEHAIDAASIAAVGAFEDVVLGYFDWEAKDYRRIPIDEQVEVLALSGNIVTRADRPTVHAHVVVGKGDASTAGGHLLEAHVRPTLEMLVTESPAHLRRTEDPTTGLAVLAVGG